MNFLDQDIKYLKGVGPQRAELLQKELNVFTVRDLLYLFPFRYVDKTTLKKISQAKPNEVIQIRGTLISLAKVKGRYKSRLSGYLTDQSGTIELVWFQGINWIQKALTEGAEYIAYGKVNFYKGNKSIVHPEMELVSEQIDKKLLAYEPVYPSTEKLNARGLESKTRRQLIQNIFSKIAEDDLPENLPDTLRRKMRLCSRFDSLSWIHFPDSEQQIKQAKIRLKFEEIFFLQLRLLISKQLRTKKLKGITFSKVGDYVNSFYKEVLPFELTGAQKRVIREIRADLGSGAQMNRLLQGDVGSGKTIVAVMAMLIAIDNGYQACLMAPTEILAFQHYQSLMEYVDKLDLQIGFLTGQVTGNPRKELLQALADGEIQILIGTHALIESPVRFQSLGLAITDEQHRFGVVQRAKLWKKNVENPPHILVMTATPIPRTLSMTVYGDLDVSTIDEMPPGRKPVKTLHKRETHRAQVIQFMHSQIAQGRQVYVVFPLIEESEKLDLQNLQEGYEQLLQYFPRPEFQISIVHGKMKPKDKDAEMERFVKGKSQILVSTTVIEVGVDVPNATVMVIESAERFGLSQLHQLRGRVGRGAEQSYCILMTSFKLTKEAKERLQTMVRTNNGFEIAEVDLRLRGPGDIEGTRQSGIKEFRIFDLIHDTKILQAARHTALRILEEDPELKSEQNRGMVEYIKQLRKKYKDWGRIS